MINIINIFVRDIKNIFTNWAAILVVTTLMMLPSLYSLINIVASWDPYGNTNGIKVAIVNEDKGTVYKNQDINLGNDLVDKLKDNDKLGWTFVDEDEAKNGVINEKYYAMIEIPEDFSENVTTVTTKNVVNPKLIYTVNEKKNVIASKITDAGIDTVKTQVDENIKKTLSGVMFRLFDEIGIDIKNNRSELRNIIDYTYNLDENMPKLEKLLDQAIDGTINTSQLIEKTNEIIPVASDTIDGTVEFLNNSQTYLDQSQTDLENESPKIKDDLVKTEKILDNSSVELKNLDETILPEIEKKSLLQALDVANASKISVEDAKSKLKSIKKVIDKISKIDIPNPEIDSSITDQTQLEQIKESIDKQVEALENAQDSLKSQSKEISKIIARLDTIDENLDKLIDRINKDLDKINNGEKVIDTQELTDTRKLLDDTHTLVSNILDGYDSQIIPIINKSFDSMRVIIDDGLNLSAQTKKTLPDIEEMLNTFNNTANLSKDELSKLKEKFPDIKNNLHELVQRLKKIDNKDDIDELLDMVTDNWSLQSDFLSSPVEIQDNRLFPWPNYGSTVTPFYTVLCLWIGGYTLSVLIGTEVKPLKDGVELKRHEKYFGRLPLFLFIGIGQALIASLGALFILHSYAVHPVMFVLYSIFISIVFNCFIYTAVSLFDYGGIVIGVVLLVIQVAGTSGNFPIEVNPTIFQTLFPFLPFTYAISAVRQIMAGIVYSILIKDTIILLGIMIGSIIIGLVFKEPVNKRTANMIKKLKETSIMSS